MLQIAFVDNSHRFANSFCEIFFFFLIIFTALVSSVFRALTPWATEYKSDVEKRLPTLLGQPVSIKTMETGEQVSQDKLWLHSAENFSL